ncbi:hypothetical protein RhiirC2_795627 [Rhizophagus irregularis]|uniref:Kelch-like protein 17 n=1 Tax=Rhizophagus irregularis TaxID=588596 RepID=A0A2N1MB70_9GLOM|nr:hypothetical protein RhiirC2_795627 [Rhizophagus irregularis]
MPYNYESELSKALGQLLKIETDYNVIIHIGELPNFKEFHAHSNILRCRSEYFDKILSAENIEKKDGKYLIKKPNISPQAFNVILKYLYTSQIDITNKTGTELLNFMIVSNELMLKNLTKFIEDFIIENQQQFLQNDPIGIFQIIYYSQEQVLNQDVSKWSKDDINIFKRVLYKFIPLIRFYDISSRDYFNKVKPYEKLLSKELRDDILKSHMIPEYKPIYTPRHSKNNIDIDSVIINRKHIALFSNWIDKKENIKYINDIPYKFNLLYRASRDGNSATAFHAKCDNMGATIVIIKTKNSNQIVGGYNPLQWDLSGYKSTKDSFVFLLTDRTNLQTAKVGYSNGDEYSIVCDSHTLPFFGYNNLYLQNSSWICSPVKENGQYSYPELDGMKGTYDVDDYEVFQVMKQ